MGGDWDVDEEGLPERRRSVGDCQERTWRENDVRDVPCVVVE